MTALAALLGRFVGAMLAECGPMIAEILASAFRPTSEDGARRDALRERLLAMLPKKEVKETKDANPNA